MARPQKVQKVAAAQAREGKAQKKLFNSGRLEISPIASSETGSPAEDSEMESESDVVECTGWTGGISHPFKLSDSEDDSVWLGSDTDVDSDEDFDLEELEGQDLVEEVLGAGYCGSIRCMNCHFR